MLSLAVQPTEEPIRLGSLPDPVLATPTGRWTPISLTAQPWSHHHPAPFDSSHLSAIASAHFVDTIEGGQNALSRKNSPSFSKYNNFVYSFSLVSVHAVWKGFQVIK